MNRSAPAALLCLSLSVAGLACTLHLPQSSGEDFEAHASRIETHPLELGPGATLELETHHGVIEVVALDDPGAVGGPVLRATLRAGARSEERARVLLERTVVVLEYGPTGLQVRVDGEAQRVQSDLALQVDFVATVPSGTAVVARSSAGDLLTRGALGALHFSTGHGAIRIAEARGDVHARSSSGDVEVQRIEGDYAVLISGFGAIRVQEAHARRVTCASGSGDLRIDASTADELELDTSFGAIEAMCGGAVRASSGSGDIRLRGARGAVNVESRFGQIEIDGVLTALALTTGSGDVLVQALPGSRVDPAWTLSSSFGEVTLAVPDGFSCQLDARTNFGSVECSFPVTIEAGQRAAGNQLKGMIGSGGETVTLSSGSGNVSLRKL